MHDDLEREMDEVRDPKIDDLSNQLVGMMNERKNEPAHNRLYKKGQEKIRRQAILEYEKNLDQDTTMRRERPNHRGTVANEALYQLDSDIRAHKEQMRREKEYMEDVKARTKFESKESAQMRINGFKKEFTTRLEELKYDGMPFDGSQIGDIDAKQYDLDFQ